MSLTVAFQMDPIAGLNIAGDSTFALMLKAQEARAMPSTPTTSPT